MAGAVVRETLHVPALNALLAVVLAPRQWESANQIASDAGITPATLSHARNGRRQLPANALDALTKVLADSVPDEKVTPALFRDALVLPERAKSGDVRSKELIAALHETQDVLTRLTRKVMTNGD